MEKVSPRLKKTSKDIFLKTGGINCTCKLYISHGSTALLMHAMDFLVLYVKPVSLPGLEK